MNEEKKSRLMWGCMLLVGALGSISLRNNPEIGITPVAVGIVDGLVFACILMAVRVADWRMSAVIALASPVFMWSQRFLDGFMIPVEILINLTLIGSMLLIMKNRWRYVMNVAVLMLPAFAMMLLAETAAIWIVKEEKVLRALIIAWNTDVYSVFSLLGAVLVCTPTSLKKA